MKLMNFILWLTAGAIIGWIAGWMAEAEHSRELAAVADEEDDQ